MNGLDLLTADHNRFRGLAARITTALEADDVETAAPLVAEVHRELDVHTDVEEKIVYPWAREISDEIADSVYEGLEEHHVADRLLAEIDQLEPTAEEWAAKVKVLIENVEHHAEEEESEMFAQIRSAASAEKLDRLGEQIEERKKAQGAPVTADKIDLTDTELRRLASEQEIPGRSKMDHDVLAATVAPPS